MGTDSWKNWRAFDAGAPELENFDDELQSDVAFIGGPVSVGPFQISVVLRKAGSVGPAVMVHGGIHANLLPNLVVDNALVKADSSGYHGGTMSDEVASLISLTLGVRLRLAGTRRLSLIHQPGVVGPPVEFEVPRLARPGHSDREIIPAATTRVANLDELSRLDSFGAIPELAQIELVRAA